MNEDSRETRARLAGRRQDEALRALRQADDAMKAEEVRCRQAIAKAAAARKAAVQAAKKTGLTAGELATELGVSPQRVYQLLEEDPK